MSNRARPGYLRDLAHNIRYGLMIYALTLVGHVPLHSLRRAAYRAAGVSCPRDSILYWGGRWFSPAGVSVGNHSIIGDHFFLDGREGIQIGSNVNIASEVRIWTQQHDSESPTFAVVGGPVSIGDWSFIGSRVTILPNVRIGVGCVIGAGAVVVKDIPDWTVAVGVPAKVVRARQPQSYTLSTKSKFWFQ